MDTKQQQIEKLFHEAVTHHLEGNLDLARTGYNEILRLDPTHQDALRNQGALFISLGQNQRAEEFLRQALALDRRSVDALNNLATALKNQKKYHEALDVQHEAIKVAPNNHTAFFNLANLYREMDLPDKSLAAFSRAQAINPEDHETLNGMGALFLRLGRYDEAKDALQKGLLFRSDHALTHYNLGIAFLREGELDNAVRSFQTAISLSQRFSDAHLNLGIAFQRRGENASAVSCFKKATETNPKSADAYYNLGLILETAGDLDGALKTQSASMAHCPDAVQTWIGGIRVFSQVADWRQADPLYEKVLHYPFSQDEQSLLSDVLFMLHGFSVSDEVISEKHRIWGDYACRWINRRYPHGLFRFPNPANPSGKIRVGYVSPDFRRHSVGWFFEHIVAHHDRGAFDIYCYATSNAQDDVTDRIAQRAAVFKNVHHLRTEDLANTIFDDGIQILVDLAGHTRENRLDVFCLRPAPIQVTYLGYPYDTGLEHIHFRITDHASESPLAQQHYRSSLVFLKNCFLPLGPMEKAALNVDRTALGFPDKGTVLISFNRADKLRPDVLRLWDALLERCPEAILALGCGHIERQDLRENILTYFSSPNTRNRVFFLGREKTEERHRARYQVADLALDTFPYAGTTTSFEALAMKVPVVTLVGDRHVQRTTYSMLKHLGIEDTIAHTQAEYLEKAVFLVSHPESLRDLKLRICKAVEETIQTQPTALTKELETTYRTMWESFVGGRLPQ
jgi:protein O-GlcNAc transferase